MNMFAPVHGWVGGLCKVIFVLVHYFFSLKLTTSFVFFDIHVLEVFFEVHRIPVAFFLPISYVTGRCEDWYNASGPSVESRGRMGSAVASAELNSAILNQQLGHWHAEPPTGSRPAALVLKVWRAMVGKDIDMAMPLPWHL